MSSDLAKLSESGRISIPARFRKLLNLDCGATMTIRVENGELRLRPVRQVLASLQDRLSRFPTQESGAESGVEWLLNQRRQEIASENAPARALELAESQAPLESPAHEHPGRERDHCPAGTRTGPSEGR